MEGLGNAHPLVSVIIPCYNVAPYVEKAILSILSQTYTNLEIWIIDDASIDDTLQKINTFRDDRIRVVSCKVNTQKVGAVNEVLQKVRGDFICFQDADDWSEPTRVEEQLQQFEGEPGLGICFTNYTYVGIVKKRNPGKIALTNEELRDEFLEFFKKKNGFNSPTNCPTMMISKEALLKTGGYSPYFAGRVAEDIQWIYRILKDFKGSTVVKPLYNYAAGEGSFSRAQASGKNARYAYSWQLLSKIIHKDIHENIDVLLPENKEILHTLELEACEEALVNALTELNATRHIYESSNSYKLGRMILYPWRIIISIFNKLGARNAG